MICCLQGHNPYFSRWFSAIRQSELFRWKNEVTILILVDGFLQYKLMQDKDKDYCHNPYFSRWFSAIWEVFVEFGAYKKVTILILVDGFLQLNLLQTLNYPIPVTILILVDGFLQFN